MRSAISIAVLAGALVVPASATRAQPPQDKPDLYVISIGIKNYKAGLPGRIPTFAEQDARDMAAAFTTAAGTRFRSVHVDLLLGTEGKATLAGLNATLLKIARQARPQDTFIFFYSGKGRSIDRKNDSQFYLFPSDITPGPFMEKRALSASELEYWFLRIPCHQQLIAFDSSKSSRGFEDFKERIDMENARLARIAHRDMVVLSVKEWSFEFASLKHGLFTSMLLRALEGGAASASGEISARSLADYITRETPNVLARAATPKARVILRSDPASGLPYVYTSGDDFVLGSRTVGTERPTMFEKAGFVSARSVYTYRHNPLCTYTPGPAPAGLHRKGKDFALLIAENNYDHWPKLRNPISDATAIADTLSRRYGFQTEVLTDPTNACIDDAIERYSEKQYAPDSQLLIYFAGHGVYIDTRHTSFLVPRESTTLSANRARSSGCFRETLTPYRQTTFFLSSMHVKQAASDRAQIRTAPESMTQRRSRRASPRIRKSGSSRSDPASTFHRVTRNTSTTVRLAATRRSLISCWGR